VGRVYCSITLGCPHPAAGRVLTNIDRDPGERKRMAAFPYGSTQGRLAASNYLVLQSLAGGAAALVQWRLETGRTHQIRQQDLRSVVMPLSRPTLHAKSLAFEHPATGQRLEFESQLPKDFQELLQSLQQLD
ncbi:RNA pseudourine synthase 2, chloroplastic, partial [Haematococcus lacustris]